MSNGIYAQPICDTPIAVIDFETTGLTPGTDRVVEVSVVRVDPGEEPRLVFDTLVNPQREVAATEIHGITDSHVADAPEFCRITSSLDETLFVEAGAGTGKTEALVSRIVALITTGRAT